MEETKNSRIIMMRENYEVRKHLHKKLVESTLNMENVTKNHLKDLPNSNQPEPEVLSWARIFFQW